MDTEGDPGAGDGPLVVAAFPGCETRAVPNDLPPLPLQRIELGHELRHCPALVRALVGGQGPELVPLCEQGEAFGGRTRRQREQRVLYPRQPEVEVVDSPAHSVNGI